MSPNESPPAPPPQARGFPRQLLEWQARCEERWCVCTWKVGVHESLD